MHSKRYLGAALALAALASACSGETRGQKRRDVVGSLPDVQANLALWPDLNTVLVPSRAGHVIDQFTLSPPTHVRAVPLARPEADQIALPSADARYFVTVSGYGYAIIKADGTAVTDPVEVPGDILACAFAPSQGFLALLDDEQNLVLATISSAGDVTGTWKTTTQLPSKEWAVTSAMLTDGTLLLATSGSHVAVVDVAGSVQAQAWQETDVAVPDATDLQWVAGVPGTANNTALLLDANRLVLLDLKTSAVLDQKSLGSAEVLGAFRDLTPHILSQTQDEQQKSTNDLTYPSTDGKLTTVSIQGTTSQLTGTLLDASGGTLAVAYNPNVLQSASYNPDRDYYSPRTIPRFHLTDGSALDTATIDGRVAVSLRPMVMLALHPAALGKATVLGYGPTPAATTLQGYDYRVVAALNAP